eukprot:TRINITY_DN8980_c0_g1_i1.p1 TRINITY_DN8980_c0_g1~~TRINITY_DN8980_c0_g1_i1.p1  ORF type:complete len:359 (+),score=41.62 TRINITY_DN8980_c0_g1_i1:61-1137(+)
MRSARQLANACTRRYFGIQQTQCRSAHTIRVRDQTNMTNTSHEALPIYFHSCYTHPLKERHRFPMERYEAVQSELRRRNFPYELLQPSSPAGLDEVCLAHARDYACSYYYGRLTDQQERVIGFPWTPEFVIRTCTITGATIEAMMAVLFTSAMAASNAAGGTHHAFTDRGEGFCIYNDIAVALRLAQFHQWIDNAIVVDLDVHQGNGTAEIFRADPNVYTLSVHGDSNYPWKSRVPGDADYALPDDCSQQLFLDTVTMALEHVEQRLTIADRTLVIYQAGVDPLAEDRLGRLSMTRETLWQRNQLVFDFCAKHNLPVVTTMGGGYAKPIERSAEAHVDVFQQAAAHFQRMQTTAEARI